MSARGRAFFVMDLARELKMTKRMLLRNLDSYEIEEWVIYFREILKKKPDKQSPQQIEGQLKNAFMARSIRR